MSGGAGARPFALASLLLIGAWLGAGAIVAAVVAPAAFAVLPTRTLAGALVGRVLPPLFYWGIATGLVAVLAARGLGRDRLVTTATVAGFVTAVSCAVAQLVVEPRIERVRAEIPGPVDALPPGDARRAEFGRLHAASVLWLGAGMLAAGVAAVTIAVRLRRQP